MLTDTELSQHLDPELKSAFIAEAAAAERLPAEILRELVQDFVTRQQEAREHDEWFRAEVEAGLREADDPTVARIPHEEVVARWQLQRAELMKRLA
jgi:predicted transcriptional regulator